MMNDIAVEVAGLYRRYGRHQALDGLDLVVQKGQCHGFFGRNGAGKTTALKCLLNHVRPDQGKVRIFDMDPTTHEVEVKSRLGYVPDETAFYPWMTVRGTLDYMASFRRHWNRDVENELLRERFGLDPKARVDSLSKGMKAQLALVCALCPEPELLILDEPTSGLDPVLRRELIETVIGTYQAEDPGQRTILVSTHMISELEGLIDAFTIIKEGRHVVAVDADEARRRFKRIWLQFEDAPPAFSEPQVLQEERAGRDVQLIVRDFSSRLEQQLRAHHPKSMRVEDLSMEAIFIACTKGRRT